MTTPTTYEKTPYSGYHMICDIKEIQEWNILNDIESLKKILDIICKKYDFHILQKIEHKFEPQGSTVIYMLSESHISIHTFPEKKYMAFDIYTCRQYTDNSTYEWIYSYLIETLCAKKEEPNIICRYF
jgi:S-adenosylmethionine decarboxylase proenzyme